MTEEEYLPLARRVLKICEAHGTECVLHNFVNAASELGCRKIHLPLSVLRELNCDTGRREEDRGKAVAPGKAGGQDRHTQPVRYRRRRRFTHAARRKKRKDSVRTILQRVTSLPQTAKKARAERNGFSHRNRVSRLHSCLRNRRHQQGQISDL